MIIQARGGWVGAHLGCFALLLDGIEEAFVVGENEELEV